MIQYKINIIEELSKKGYNTGRIRKAGFISESTLTQIRKGEAISMKALNSICIMLRCQPGDIIEVIPTDEEKIKYF